MMTCQTGKLVLETGPRGSALLSDDRIYRYRLTRPLGKGGLTVLWILLNPSIADATVDDMTVKKCIGFSRKFEASSLVMVNLFAYRATNPVELLRVADPVGPRNLDILKETGLGAELAIAAWGGLSNKLWMRARPSLDVVANMNGLKCLGRTKSGAPLHPSRLGYNAILEPWAA